MAIKKGDAKYTKPFVGNTDVIIMMSVECGVSFASTCRLDYDTVHALEQMIVDSTFVEDEAGQTEKCDRSQMDCENCWKELHCRAKTENSSEIPNNCEHITEDGVTCAKYPACDDCPDNPLNKVKGSERLVKGSEKPNNLSEIPTGSEPQTTMDCSKCRYFPDGGERCDLCALGIMDEPQTERSE